MIDDRSLRRRVLVSASPHASPASVSQARSVAEKSCVRLPSFILHERKRTATLPSLPLAYQHTTLQALRKTGPRNDSPHVQRHDRYTANRRKEHDNRLTAGGHRTPLPSLHHHGPFISDQTRPVSSHLIELDQLFRRVRMRRVVGGAVRPELLYRPTRPRRFG